MHHKKNKFVILISGPTATGKSNFAIHLGNTLPIEIVNADIGSFYTPLTIGTAKPDWREESIPHHFFDIVDTPENFTAPLFRQKLDFLIQEIWSRGNIPVVVGGSAFYVQSFFYKNHELTSPDQQTIDDLESQSADLLWQQLVAIDAVRADQIDKNDHYRLVRALAIWQTNRIKPSQFAPQFAPLAPFHFVTLTRDRDALYSMINARVESMMQEGWLCEVRQLAQSNEWEAFLKKKKMIGYDLLLEYLEHDAALQDLSIVADTIAQKTRNYAKRQVTFLKRLQAMIKKDMQKNSQYADWIGIIQDFNLDLYNKNEIVEQLGLQAFYK